MSSTRLFALSCTVLALGACESGSSKGTGDIGSVHMALDVASGITLSTISYSITGPSMLTKSGFIDVSHSATLGGTIAGLPAGVGYTIVLSGTSDQGDTTCTGSQTFSITAHQTTSVAVNLSCKQPTKFGSASVNGALNVCPVIDSIGSSPSEAFVGGSIALSGLAHDTDGGPMPLAYSWTVSPSAAGTIANPGTQNTTFVCAAAGTASITLTVSDGDAICVDTQTIPVTCTSPSGAGGTTGAGGATGGSGGASGGIGGASGGSGGAGGATGGTGGATGGTGGASGPDVVVYRVGDGTSALAGTGNAVFIDEFTSAGALVKTTALPTTASGANKPLIASGTASSEGLITRSIDGKYVLFAGYGVAPGGSTTLTGTSSATVPRVVGRLDAAGNLDTTTALTDFSSGGSPRSVASTDGVSLWLTGGAGGAHFATLGGTTSVTLNTTAPTNLRAAGIFDSQLYISAASTTFRLASISGGLPTTGGQTITNLSGSATTGSPYAFFFADLDGSPGVDTVYVADDSSGFPGGLTKYSLTGGSWATSNGTAGNAADAYRGVTGVVVNSTVTLFAVRKGGTSASGGGELVTISDASGFGGALSGTPVLLASAPSGTVATTFRGVALAPTP